MDRILVVGCGITGAVSALLVRQQLPNAIIEIWEKSRGTGGRMGTSRIGDTAESPSTVDLGAQYITSLPTDLEKHKRFYDTLFKERLLEPLKGKVENLPDYPDGAQHYVASDGVGSIVKHFVKLSGAETRFNTCISHVDCDSAGLNVKTDNGILEKFDKVVLTMPIPQILQLKGQITDILDKQSRIKDNLKKVTYSCRYAIGLYYPPDVDLNIPWVAKYIQDNPCIRFVAIDTMKRNQGSSGGTTVCVHTSVPFSLKHLEEDKDNVCSQHVLPAFLKLFPSLPPASFVKNHKWRYSQVYEGYDESPGAIMLNDFPRLIAAGDGFCSASGLNHCLRSADSAVQLLLS